MTATIPATVVADTVLRLRAAGCVFAEEEADMLVRAAADEATLDAMVLRRVRGEPLEQVVGYAEFCGLRVRLRPGVFVPRVRSELLVRLAARAVHATRAARSRGPVRATETAQPTGTLRATETAQTAETAETAVGDRAVVVVDLCCGSGALGLATRAAAGGTAVELHAADADPVAVACARDNLGAHVYAGDLFAALPGTLRGRVHVLLANVPYVATGHLSLLPAEARDHEPRTALDGGHDGLDVFRAVLAAAGSWLGPRGTLLSEITEAQAGAATAAVKSAGLRADIVRDDDLEATVVVVTRP